MAAHDVIEDFNSIEFFHLSLKISKYSSCYLSYKEKERKLNCLCCYVFEYFGLVLYFVIKKKKIVGNRILKGKTKQNWEIFSKKGKILISNSNKC